MDILFSNITKHTITDIKSNLYTVDSVLLNINNGKLEYIKIINKLKKIYMVSVYYLIIENKKFVLNINSNDIINKKNEVDDNIIDINKHPVYDQEENKIGEVYDYTFDNMFMILKSIYTKNNFLYTYKNRIFDKSDIIKISKDKIIVNNIKSQQVEDLSQNMEPIFI